MAPAPLFIKKRTSIGPVFKPCLSLIKWTPPAWDRVPDKTSSSDDGDIEEVSRTVVEEVEVLGLALEREIAEEELEGREEVLEEMLEVEEEAVVEDEEVGMEGLDVVIVEQADEVVALELARAERERVRALRRQKLEEGVERWMGATAGQKVDLEAQVSMPRKVLTLQRVMGWWKMWSAVAMRWTAKWGFKMAGWWSWLWKW